MREREQKRLLNLTWTSEYNVYGQKYQNTQIHFLENLGIYGSKGTGKNIYFGHPRRKSRKIHFGYPIVLISPKSHHTPYVTYRKWTHLNTTLSRRPLITKMDSQETILKYIKITWQHTRERQHDFKRKQLSKRGPRQTTKISETPHGCKASLKSVILCGAEE